MVQRNPADGRTQNVANNHLEENRPGDLSLQMNHKNQAQNQPRRLALRWAAYEHFSVPVRASVRFEQPGALRPVRRRWERGRRFVLSSCLPLAVLVLLAGCSSPAVRQQRLVSKANMTFSDSTTLTYNSPRLLPQMAPGFPGGDASSNSGCSSCR